MAAVTALALSAALLAGSAAAAATTRLVPPTKDGGLYFSEHNWAMMTDTAVSVNSGAYIKAVFTGSARASFALQVALGDTRALSVCCTPSHFGRSLNREGSRQCQHITARWYCSPPSRPPTPPPPALTT